MPVPGQASLVWEWRTQPEELKCLVLNIHERYGFEGFGSSICTVRRRYTGHRQTTHAFLDQKCAEFDHRDIGDRGTFARGIARHDPPHRIALLGRGTPNVFEAK